MALNTAHAVNGVLIYAGERILLYCEGVEIRLEASGVPHFKGNKNGRVYLTTHRVIFNNNSSKDALQSFSMPFYCMKEVELEQPVFGSNFIKGKILAQENGNWKGVATFKLWFKHGGAIEFGQAMLKAGYLASKNMGQAPPPYTPPQGPFYQAPPPAYTPEAQYSWVPYHQFPSAPPPEYIYTTQLPPPYPGIESPYPPQQNGMVNGSDAKAQEAAQSAYYNPANPHNVYAPSQVTASAPPPPSYDEATKKQN